MQIFLCKRSMKTMQSYKTKNSNVKFTKTVLACFIVLLMFGCGGKPSGDIKIKMAKGNTDPYALIDTAEDGRFVSSALLDLASLTDREIRAALALALGRIGNSKATFTLLNLLKDNDAIVRSNAAFALGIINYEKSTSVVKDLFFQMENEKDEKTIIAILDAIGRLATENELAKLAYFNLAQGDKILAAKIRAIGFAGRRGVVVSDKLIAQIAGFLNYDSADVRFMSAFTLFRVKQSSVSIDVISALKKASLQDNSSDVRAYAIKAVFKYGGYDEVFLLKVLGDSNTRVVSTAVLSLEFVKEKKCDLVVSAFQFIVPKLNNDPSLFTQEYIHVVRGVVKESIGCLDHVQVNKFAAQIYKMVSSLEKPLTAGAARVRCLSGLAALHDELSLVSCDRERPWYGKKMLAKMLANNVETKPNNLKILIELLNDPDPRVVTESLNSLGKISEHGAAADAILNTLDDKNVVVVSAALDVIALKHLMFTAQSENSVLTASDDLLSGLKKVIKRFFPFEHAQRPLISAASVLANYKDENSLNLLAKLVTDPRPAVRSAALSAYDKLENNPPEILSALKPQRPFSHKEKIQWREKNISINVVTTRGDFEIEFFADIAPSTVASFVMLAKSGYFDGTEIHRVVSNFVVQTGDPSGTGIGDPGYTIRCEVSPLTYKRGTVGMALSGKDTGGSQFFIALSPQPHLDGSYTVFGKVKHEEQMHVLDLLEEGDFIVEMNIILK